MPTALTAQTDPTQQELKALADQHLEILQQTAKNRGFRHLMPPGGQQAIDAGLVTEGDPNWMYSDAYAATNGFLFTDLGRKVAEFLGWTCQCSGCCEQNRQKGWNPAITLDRVCPPCRVGILKYGKSKFKNQTCCRFHRRKMEEIGLAEPTLTASNQQEPSSQTYRVRPDYRPDQPWKEASPSDEPHIWRWRRRNKNWVATGSRPLNADETPPKLGHVVTVQKRNGQKSQHQVNQHVGMTRDGFPQLGVGPQIG